MDFLAAAATFIAKGTREATAPASATTAKNSITAFLAAAKKVREADFEGLGTAVVYGPATRGMSASGGN